MSDIDGKAYVNFSMTCTEGEIQGYATLNCTFDQLASALAASFDNKSFTTVQLHPDHRMNITRRREG